MAYNSAHAYSAAANVHEAKTRDSVNNTAAMDMKGLAQSMPRILEYIPLGLAMKDPVAAALDPATAALAPLDAGVNNTDCKNENTLMHPKIAASYASNTRSTK